MLFESGEWLPAPPVPPLGKLAGRGAVRRGLCPCPGPLPKIRSRERAWGRGLVCFARKRPGIGVRPCAPPGPRPRAQRLEGLTGAAGVFHREEKVTRGRDRESRGRGLPTPEPGSGLDASGHRVLGLGCSRLPCPRGPYDGGHLRAFGSCGLVPPRGSGRKVLGLRPGTANPPHSCAFLHTTHCGPGSPSVVNGCVCPLPGVGGASELSSPVGGTAEVGVLWDGLLRSHTLPAGARCCCLRHTEYSGSPGSSAQPPAY